MDWEGRMEAMAPTLSGPDTPGFLFLGVCEANRLQCSYSHNLKRRIGEACLTPFTTCIFIH
jgi:hypothetical protein